MVYLDEPPDVTRLWQVLTARPIRKVFSEEEKCIMGSIAFHSGGLEDQAWNCWELHRDALLDAYDKGRRRERITLYDFFRWHRAILPFGGMLRECNPVSQCMGESFKPAPVAELPGLVHKFVRSWCDVPESDPWLALARRHFDQWAMHPWADGNKRHARLITVYGCGWFQFDPVCISLFDRTRYLDCLDGSNIAGLAALFQERQMKGYPDESRS